MISCLRLLLFVCGLLVLATRVHAQVPDPDPRFPVLGKSVFGVSSQYPTQAVLPSPVGLNPATQNYLLDYKLGPALEADYGLFGTRSNLQVGMGILNYFQPIGKRHSVRLSVYQVWSNEQPIPATGPVAVDHNGNAFELVYAYRVSDQLDLGVAWVPYDRMKTDLSLAGAAVGSGSARSNFQGRVGIAWRDKSQKLRVGVVYSHDALGTKATFVGVPGEMGGSFLQRSWTGGISYDPRPGTTLFYNYQSLSLQGEGVSLDRSSSYWGLQQFLGKHWLVRFARASAGTEISLGYTSGKWEGYLSFNGRAYSQSEDVYGRGSLLFVSAVRKF